MPSAWAWSRLTRSWFLREYGWYDLWWARCRGMPGRAVQTPSSSERRRWRQGAGQAMAMAAAAAAADPHAHTRFLLNN